MKFDLKRWVRYPGVRMTILVLIISFVTVQCTSPGNEEPFTDDGFPYDFSHPDNIIRLPGSLVEISGFVLLDSLHGIAIQDEEGVLFDLDLRKGDITGLSTFGRPADYEDLARTGSGLFALRSDGYLIRIPENRDSTMVRSTNLGLPSGCDAEGLASDPVKGRLLVACKEPVGPGGDTRVIYAFDPITNRMAVQPIYTFTRDQMEEWLRTHRPTTNWERLLGLLEEPVEPVSFAPSALAVHPTTHQVYVVSSDSKDLLVLSPEGAIERMISLPQDLFPKPEGMAFSCTGDLYVTNESKGGAATILRFRYTP